MANTISKADITDLDILDAAELGSDGSVVYLTTTVVSTTAGTKAVVVALPVDGEGLLTSRDHPVQAEDLAAITGTSGGLGDGTFTVASVDSNTQFTVVEAIGTSTGGSVSFQYQQGALGVGFDATKQNVTSANKCSQVLTDLGNHDLLNNEPVGLGVTYTVTRVGTQVTQEKWVNTSNSRAIRQIDYTYTSGKVTQEVRKVFAAADGTTVLAQVTITYTYTGALLTSETVVRNV